MVTRIVPLGSKSRKVCSSGNHAQCESYEGGGYLKRCSAYCVFFSFYFFFGLKADDPFSKISSAATKIGIVISRSRFGKVSIVFRTSVSRVYTVVGPSTGKNYVVITSSTMGTVLRSQRGKA